jgi:nitrogen regulatory protein PII 2
MKEIIAIIRPKKMGPTKEALDKLGFPCMTAVSVLGRGKQKGIAGEISLEVSPEVLAQGKFRSMTYIPKRLLSLVVPDGAVDAVVRTLIEVNRTAQVGDGRIFICPVEDAMRVRTDEHGEQAIL